MIDIRHRLVGLIPKLGIRVIRRVPTLAQQAALELEAGIRSGDLVGERGLLPSEPALSRRLGISRSTLREALSGLERRGLIVRRHGVGTFVGRGGPVLDAELDELESLDGLARRLHLETHMLECSVQERPATAAEARSLRATPGTAVVSIERVIGSGDRALAMLVDIVPADILRPSDLDETFSGSVLDLLGTRGTPLLDRSRAEMYAEPASSRLTRMLQVHRRDPILKLTAELYATNGRIVDYSVSYFVPRYFRFQMIRQIRSSTGDGQLQPQSPAEATATDWGPPGTELHVTDDVD